MDNVRHAPSETNVFVPEQNLLCEPDHITAQDRNTHALRSTRTWKLVDPQVRSGGFRQVGTTHKMTVALQETRMKTHCVYEPPAALMGSRGGFSTEGSNCWATKQTRGRLKLALRCLYSRRLDTRLVDITAVQEVAAEEWITWIYPQKNHSEWITRHQTRFMLRRIYTIRHTKNKMEDDCDEAVSLQLSGFLEFRWIIWRGQKPWHPPPPKPAINPWEKQSETMMSG